MEQTAKATTLETAKTAGAGAAVPLCDPETGVCVLPGAGEELAGPAAPEPHDEILYVGDPMCSACWGISPALRRLEAAASTRGIPFRILMGGLRAGGGDAWTPEFRAFLRHHWEETAARTGQPFSTRFLDRASFDYDTEPSCRAFVVLRGLLNDTLGPAVGAYDLFAAIQRKFYVAGEDPTVASFYQSICEANGLDFGAFVRRFDHPDSKRLAALEFQEARALGVRSFPTILYRDGASARRLAIGNMTAARLVDVLDSLRSNTQEGARP